ncbi:MAG: hypothetical protein WA261_03250 [Candidatus Sulfotelmatobacter sp.]|jgi:hypothetical protein
MLEQDDKNWKDLCCAVLEAEDSGKLLEIVQKLNKALKREEQLDRSLQKSQIGKTSEDVRC